MLKPSKLSRTFEYCVLLIILIFSSMFLTHFILFTLLTFYSVYLSKSE